MIEPLDHGAIAALRRESADMAFEHDGFRPRPAAPVFRAPAIGRLVDHFARAGNVFRLERGGRVGYVDLVVDTEFVTRAGLHTGDIGGEPAVIVAAKRMRL